jgi:pyrimidine-specific ribonucleoside hydrolase
MMITMAVGQEILVNTEIHAHSLQGIVFFGFPMHDEDYSADVLKIRDEAIARYGKEEWRFNVLTSELHGHLGIYAIIGSKMGLFAREILAAGHDELGIVSYAGSRPPVSCLNDGLQVSTGATLGHGLIKVLQVEKPVPFAEFTYKETKIKISLKEPIMNEIEETVKKAAVSSGGLTDEYWMRIRELALQYWLNLDRNDIFTVNAE